MPASLASHACMRSCKCRSFQLPAPFPLLLGRYAAYMIQTKWRERRHPSSRLPRRYGPATTGRRRSVSELVSELEAPNAVKSFAARAERASASLAANVKAKLSWGRTPSRAKPDYAKPDYAMPDYTAASARAPALRMERPITAAAAAAVEMTDTSARLGANGEGAARFGANGEGAVTDDELATPADEPAAADAATAAGKTPAEPTLNGPHRSTPARVGGE